MDSLTFLLTELFVQRQTGTLKETLKDIKELCHSYAFMQWSFPNMLWDHPLLPQETSMPEYNLVVASLLTLKRLRVSHILMICPVSGMKNVQEKEMVVFLSNVRIMPLNLELDNAGGVLSRNDELLKKGTNEKNTANTVDASHCQGVVESHTRCFLLCH